MNPTHSSGVPAKAIPGGWPFAFMFIAAMLVVPGVYAAGASEKALPPAAAKLTGLVTNSLTGEKVVGATVTLATTTATVTVETNANGRYFRVLQPGVYDMDISADNFNGNSQQLSLLKGWTVVDVALEPNAPVIVSASVDGTEAPGEVLSAMGSYIIMDGSSYVSSSWSQIPDEGVPATISDPTSDNTTVTLGTVSEYAAHLVHVLREPPITEADLPPDLKLQPINEIEKGLQNRDQVVAITPFGLEKTQAVPLTYSVTTTSGTYSVEVDLNAALPWNVSTGVRTVPVNGTVLLFAKDQDPPAYNWTITQSPTGSAVALTDPTTQTPWLTPDIVGTYQIQETNSGAVLEVHAGRYHGVIDPLLTLNSIMFGDGRPVGDENCTTCHDGSAAPDKFTPWRQTGHAEAFSQGITTNDHFGENCFGCHTVGFGTEAGGIDSTPNYGNFVDNLLGITGDETWTTMLMDYPDTARLSNIQCENCHGPQDYTEAHKNQPGAPRVSLAPDVCGSCHGEPSRHGRFQQWQLSSHADYDLARERGAESGNCARCHSGNGFVAWGDLDFDPDQEVDVTWNEDTVQPQVCAACHDPHDTGTTSGDDGTDAKVRVMGNTHKLIAGFTAISVGKGATCMTCHNSRRGLRNESVWNTLSDGEKDDVPHHGVQADLVMGQNAYFVETGVRGKHSLIEDVCVTCHMNKTQPPDILSYNQSGTNHTFAADPNICAECHGEGGVSTDTVKAVVNSYLDILAATLADDYKSLILANYPATIGTCGVADIGNPVVELLWERTDRLDITLQDGTLCNNANPNSISTPSGSVFELSAAEYEGALEKAGWNYYLVYEDEGRGVHNPDFSLKLLAGAINAIGDLGGSVKVSGAIPLGGGYEVVIP